MAIENTDKQPEFGEHVELKRIRKLHGKSAGSLKTNYVTALRNLFGTTEGELQPWPGVIAYCTFLESCFESLFAPSYDPIWILVGISKPAGPDGCCIWFNTMCIKLHEFGEENSIGDIWDGLNPAPNTSSQNSLERITSNSTPEKAACLIAIFSVLCWVSMTLKPKLRWEDF